MSSMFVWVTYAQPPPPPMRQLIFERSLTMFTSTSRSRLSMTAWRLVCSPGLIRPAARSGRAFFGLLVAAGGALPRPLPLARAPRVPPRCRRGIWRKYNNKITTNILEINLNYRQLRISRIFWVAEKLRLIRNSTYLKFNLSDFIIIYSKKSRPEFFFELSEDSTYKL